MYAKRFPSKTRRNSTSTKVIFMSVQAPSSLKFREIIKHEVFIRFEEEVAI